MAAGELKKNSSHVQGVCENYLDSNICNNNVSSTICQTKIGLFSINLRCTHDQVRHSTLLSYDVLV